MAHEDGQVLEERISEWRSYMRRQEAIDPVDADELEDHLRSQVTALEEAGLTADEAFLIAVKRIGDLDALSREFAREYSARLWKRLVVAPIEGGDGSADGARGHRDAVVAVALAMAAALAIKIPALFGVTFDTNGAKAAQAASESFYLRNFSLLVLPFLALFFAWKRKLGAREWYWLAVPFVAGALVMNLLPFTRGGFTESLAAIHLPMALWLVVGFGYAAGAWRDHDRRMNYVRFSGEWFIYYALIALGGGVLIAFTLLLFSAIGLKVELLVNNWILPCGVAGAVIVGAWLVEAKQSVIENMAPVLTLLFTPLFTLLLLAFLVTMVVTGTGIHVERRLLIGFDLLLVLVVGLILYAISVRDERAGPRFFDKMQLVLVVCALIVDALALWAIAVRISEFGFSPNKVAALGENIVLLVNLTWSAVLYARFIGRKAPITALERWQTAYLPVYAVWASVVVVIFPLVFSFR